MIKYRYHVLFVMIALTAVNVTYFHSTWVAGVGVGLSLLSIVQSFLWSRNYPKKLAVFNQMAGPSQVPQCRKCGLRHDLVGYCFLP